MLSIRNPVVSCFKYIIISIQLIFLDTEVLTLLKTSANPKSGKKKKKAAEKAIASETAGASNDDAPPKLTPANES